LLEMKLISRRKKVKLETTDFLIKMFDLELDEFKFDIKLFIATCFTQYCFYCVNLI
jgi:hypothetical protein